MVAEWQRKQAESGDGPDHRSNILSEKEIKKEGFVMAETRYNALLPVLTRLNELDEQQRQEEEEADGGRRGGRGSGREREKEKAGKKSSKR